jgi:hypothetical protein
MPSRQVQKMQKHCKNSQDFARWPGVAACQTKMLLGEFCGKKAEIDERLYLEAERRIKSSLAFVGLTEHWNLSICLFHAMFGGSPRSGSFADVRRGSALPKIKRDTIKPVYLHEAVDEDDPWDTRLYNAAKGIFKNRLAEFGLTIPNELVSV